MNDPGRRSTDALVIGAGVIGTSIALELRRAGLEVTIVDKARAVGYGSTSASSGVVRFNYSTWDGVASAWEAVHGWFAWAKHLGGLDQDVVARYVRTGIAIIDNPLMPLDKVVPLFDRIGVPYELWSPDDLKRHVPCIDTGRYWPPARPEDDRFFQPPSGQVGALYTPDAGYVDDPQLATQNLAAAAKSLGVRFFLGSKVQEIEKNHNRVVRVRLEDGSRIETRILVNAAGPWSKIVNGMVDGTADFSVDVNPMRQEVHQIYAGSAFQSMDLPAPAIADMDLGIYIRPAKEGMVLVGGTEPECDPFEWLDDPDEADIRATAPVFQAQILRAARRFPGLKIPNRPTGIAGVYDVSSDWMPIYDRTSIDGYFVAIGTSGNQFKNAPLVGKMMSGLIEYVEAGNDHDADPYMHECEYTGNMINMGSFSRKRQPNANGSGTVMG